ncbi:hypothetical protein CEXT_555081 [Caerostris extrusa]|uniref:Uncharacterized protein n=1 Tax=Caerostris extrusa TaxID=172846 RepID=A0AAV4XQ19_CAEEX|nr:hypothetical protein CEXT_555081 [Caerostris extrusa]
MRRTPKQKRICKQQLAVMEFKNIRTPACNTRANERTKRLFLEERSEPAVWRGTEKTTNKARRLSNGKW